MSFSALNWAWEQDCSSGVAKSVLVYLANCASQEGGDCYPSLPKICKRVQHTDLAVRKALRELAAAKLIEIQPQFAENGRQRSNLYRLAVVTLAPDVPTPSNPQGYADAPTTTDQPTWMPPWDHAEPTPAESHPSTPAESHPSPLATPSESPPPTPSESRGNPSLCTRKEESTLLRNGDAAAPPPAIAPSDDVKTILWTEGKAIVRHLTGKLDGQARAQVGAFLRDAKGDCSVVLDVLQAAEREGPHLPIPWIVAGIQARLRPEPTYRMPANQIAEARGLHSKEARDEFARRLTVDHSAFGRDSHVR